MSYPNADAAWLYTLEQIMDYGSQVDPRGQSTYEIMDYHINFDMSKPVLSVSERGLGYKFMVAEAAWIMSGDNRVITIQPYSKMIKEFSDDGLYYFGAYGPKYLQQLPYIMRALTADEYTRQAVMTVWRESPMPSKDIPCTIALQWTIRDNRINCHVRMRSSDVWLGVPYDWFNFAMLTGHLMLSLREQNPSRWKNLKLGKLYWSAASQHLYYRNFQAANKIVNTLLGIRPYHPFNPYEFLHPDHLLEFLQEKAKGHSQPEPFLKEFIQ